MPELQLPALYVDEVREETAASRLVLVNRAPAPDDRDVPAGSTVRLDIVDIGNDGVDHTATRVWIQGELAFDASGLLPRFRGGESDSLLTADTLRLVFDPLVPFASEALVGVVVETATVGGAHTLRAEYSFTAEDRTSPSVVAAQAIGPRTVRLGFDEPVHMVDRRGFLFVPLELPAVRPAALDAAADGAAVVVELDTEMTPDVRYEAIVAGVTDASGNPIAPPYDRVVFTGYRPSRPARRKFDLWLMLPNHNRRADTTGDSRRFIDCLQELLDLLLGDIDRAPYLFDLERAPPGFLEHILADLGNPFRFELDVPAKRRLAASLVDMYRLKGTAVGIRNAVRLFLGIDIVAITGFASTTLVLGESELGIDWELGPSDRFLRYAFDVHVDRVLTDLERRHLRALVTYLKPAHTHFVQLVAPVEPAFVDHWLLGVSALGVESLLH